jgi:hypothetical protein
MALPPTVDLAQRDTVRLVPTGRLKEPALLPLAADAPALDELASLESATNARLRAQQAGLPDLDPHELVFGRAGRTFVNAAFTHTRPGGNRFNDDRRGAGGPDARAPAAGGGGEQRRRLSVGPPAGGHLPGEFPAGPRAESARGRDLAPDLAGIPGAERDPGSRLSRPNGAGLRRTRSEEGSRTRLALQERRVVRAGRAQHVPGRGLVPHYRRGRG